MDAQPAASALRVRTDGASRGNPGHAGIGVVIERVADGSTVDEIAEYLGQATNNTAEYRALIAALARALELGATSVEIVSDSELLVRQIEGRYQVRHPGLLPLYEEVKRLRQRFTGGFRIGHTLRGGNRRADELANLAIDRALGRPLREPADAPADGSSRSGAGGDRRPAIGASPARPSVEGAPPRAPASNAPAAAGPAAPDPVMDVFALAAALEAGQSASLGGGVRVARVRPGQARVSGWAMVLRGGVDVGGRTLEPGQGWRGGVRYRAVGEEDALVLETDAPT